MNSLRKIVCLLILLLLLVYLFYSIAIIVYFIFLLGIVFYYLKAIEYIKFKKIVASKNIVTIPQKASSIKSGFLMAIFLIGVLSALYFLDYYEIIHLPKMSDSAQFVLKLFFPILGLLFACLYSGKLDRYYILEKGIIANPPDSNLILWSDINQFQIDYNKDTISFLKDKKVIIKMEIEKRYFENQIEGIIERLHSKIYVT